MEEPHDGLLISRNADQYGVMLDSPTIPMKKGTDGTTKVPKDRKERNVANKLAINNKSKATIFPIYIIGLYKYNHM